jgi:membrane-bound metal-dependent hydrolase YbcI (DUF457 family)
VVLWFAGWSAVIVWNVFHDPAFDYRLLIVGALLPDAVDVGFGGARVLHTLVFSVALLLMVVVATRNRRALRKRLLAIPIGTLLHLVLDGMWTRAHVFWWPFLGSSFANQRLPVLDRPVALLVVEELAGAAAVVWAWRRRLLR